ncbi:MAG: phosphate acetyltransferase [Robiginitomaculum sp.]|nr:MAG: phosphate acetyltransferase [Robiginitomaculum sp.]
MQVGHKVEIKRSFSGQDLRSYYELGGELPTDNQVPDPLLASLFSYLLGMKLPGLGTNYLKQETEYMHAVYIDDVITASVTITRLRPEKHLVDLETMCVNAEGQTICSGRALVFIKDVK